MSPVHVLSMQGSDAWGPTACQWKIRVNFGLRDIQSMFQSVSKLLSCPQLMSNPTPEPSQPPLHRPPACPVFPSSGHNRRRALSLFLLHLGPHLPPLGPLWACWVSDIQSQLPHYRQQGCCCDMTGQEEVPSGSGAGRGRWKKHCWRGLCPCLTLHSFHSDTHFTRNTVSSA